MRNFDWCRTVDSKALDELKSRFSAYTLQAFPINKVEKMEEMEQVIRDNQNQLDALKTKMETLARDMGRKSDFSRVASDARNSKASAPRRKEFLSC